VANTLIKPSWIGKEVARVAFNQCEFIGAIKKKLSDDFKVAGTKVGGTIGVRLPMRQQTTKGAALQVQPWVDTVVYITITDQANIGLAWSSREATLEIQDVRENAVNPSAYQLANTLDSDGLTRVYQDVFSFEGTPGTPPNVNSTYLNAAARMTALAAPPRPRRMFINSIMRAVIANANLTLFNPPAAITELWQDAMFSGKALSWDEWYEDVNIGTHTVGTYGGTPLVNNASQTGSSLVTDGWTVTTSVLNRGDRFTVADVYATNPQNYRSTTQLAQFVVTNATTTDGSGNMTIPIYPPIITSGAYQTVTASPANNAAITVNGASGAVSPQGLGFIPEAFAMASADLILPNSGQSSRVRMPMVGLSLRYWEDSNIMTDSHPNRLDCIYGFKTIRPEFAIAIPS